MFSQLLSRSMDSKRVNEAHPAYPVLIRQLSEDEAKILNSLDHQQFDYVFTRDYNVSTALFSGMKVEVDDLPKGGLTFPENIQFYFEHLDKLGLAAIRQQGNQEPLFNSTMPRTQIGVRVRCKYTLTEFGQRFVRACVGVTASVLTGGAGKDAPGEPRSLGRIGQKEMAITPHGKNRMIFGPKNDGCGANDQDQRGGHPQ
jgi:hypothetical protein